MKLTKRQLKRIIKEEYTRLKRRGLIKESAGILPALPAPIKTAGYKEYLMDQTFGREKVIAKKVIKMMPEMFQSGEEILAWCEQANTMGFRVGDIDTFIINLTLEQSMMPGCPRFWQSSKSGDFLDIEFLPAWRNIAGHIN